MNSILFSLSVSDIISLKKAVLDLKLKVISAQQAHVRLLSILSVQLFLNLLYKLQNRAKHEDFETNMHQAEAAIESFKSQPFREELQEEVFSQFANGEHIILHTSTPVKASKMSKSDFAAQFEAVQMENEDIGDVDRSFGNLVEPCQQGMLRVQQKCCTETAETKVVRLNAEENHPTAVTAKLEDLEDLINQLKDPNESSSEAAQPIQPFEGEIEVSGLSTTFEENTSKASTSKEEAELAFSTLSSLRRLADPNVVGPDEKGKALAELYKFLGGPENLAKIIKKLGEPEVEVKSEPKKEAPIICSFTTSKKKLAPATSSRLAVDESTKPTSTIQIVEKKTKKMKSEPNPKPKRASNVELRKLHEAINEMYYKNDILNLSGPRTPRFNYQLKDEDDGEETEEKCEPKRKRAKNRVFPSLSVENNGPKKMKIDLRVELFKEPLELPDFASESPSYKGENMDFFQYLHGNLFICKLCTSESTTEDLFANHLETVHSDVTWSKFCSICDKTLEQAEDKIADEFMHAIGHMTQKVENFP